MKINITKAYKYLKTLNVELDSKHYDLRYVKIFNVNNEIIVDKQVYDVFKDGTMIQLTKPLKRRLKADTGFKKKDQAFIVKCSSDYMINENEHNLYISSEALDLELINICEYMDHMYNYSYHSKSLDIVITALKHFKADPETENKILEYKKMFDDLKYNTYISYLMKIQDLETYVENLVQSKKQLDKYNSIKTKQMLKHIDKLKEKEGCIQ